MSFLGRLFSNPEGGGRGDPWPDREYVSTDPLRDWWVVDCWFHKTPELAATHFDGFIKWAGQRPPESVAYLSWAPYTKLRVDLSCLREPPDDEIQKQYRHGANRFYVVAFCYARNEYADIEQYQSVWHQSEDYEPFGQLAEDPKNGWPRQGVKVTPDWYHEMVEKTAGSQWLGYRGFEQRTMADLG